MLRIGKGLAVDSLARSPLLAGTRLVERFRLQPLGLVDVGSRGGVHPFAEPAATLIQTLCFEPEEEAYRALEHRYATPAPYAAVELRRDALGGRRADQRPLYVTRAPVNTSLLEPDPRFIQRYRADGFTVERVIPVATRSLDDIVFAPDLASRPFGELIKLDTQGTEYEILEGAQRVLRERCVAVLCEVEFFRVYRGQNTLSDVDLLLRGHGFSLYGLYPEYRSTKSLDPARERTEERLMGADAVFFKDPLGDLNTGTPMPPRAIDSLIVAAWLTGFYDFAIELAQHYVSEAEGRAPLVAAARDAAQASAATLLRDFAALLSATKQPPAYIDIRKFTDRNASNGNIDYAGAQV